MHDELISMGFLSYVASRSSFDEVGSLFGFLKPKKGDWGATAGNWFREKLMLSVLGDKRRHGLGFHSFRHSFETSMRDNGVRKDVSDRLTGHQARDVAAGYGRYDVEAAKDAVMKIELPGALALIPVRP